MAKGFQDFKTEETLVILLDKNKGNEQLRIYNIHVASLCIYLCNEQAGFPMTGLMLEKFRC